MTNVSNVYEIINPSNTSTFSRFLSLATSCHAAVIYSALLSKSYYYKNRGMTKDGWFYSTGNDLEESTGISLCSQRTAIKILVSKGLIKCERKGLPSRRSFLVLEDVDTLNELLKIGEQKGRRLNPIAYVDNNKVETQNQISQKDFSNQTNDVSCEEYECYQQSVGEENFNLELNNDNEFSLQKLTTRRDKNSPHTYNNLKGTNPKGIQSINPRKARDTIDTIDISERESYSAYIKQKLDYDTIVENKPLEKDDYDEILGIMLDVICSKKPYIRVNGENMPKEVVKSAFLKLDESHIDYVLTSMKKNTTKVRNIRAYLITALYNSLHTINNYYRSWVNYDMYGAKA